ncbi:MAG: DUF4290 domain-containing protein [Bacteroidaceae bacterium]|nr:DUF4290 domain-containing protein [Bacteroidaceae bacterium]
MDYNTNRPSLKLPEYGRNVQKMVDYALTIADRDERQQCAETIIKVMGNIFPQQKGSTDFVRMLWDHLAFISDYKLDVDSPYPITVLSEEKQEHPHLDYPKQQIDYRHYGHTLEQMIRALSSIPEGSDREQAVELVVAQMAKSLATWNNTVLTPNKLTSDLREMTGGQVDMTISTQRLEKIIASARALTKPVNNKKKKK